ncbi:hypothetical protein Tco_0352004 [Tanacetum coccineum]
MSKYSTFISPASAFTSTLGPSSRESSYFLIISINITSPSSTLVQTYSMSGDWGTKVSDSRNELSLRTFSVTNETDGSGGEDGLVLIFFGSSFSSCSSPLGLLFEDCVTKIGLLGFEVNHLPPASSAVYEQDELPSSVRLDF